MDDFLTAIRIFAGNFDPVGYMLCDGKGLSNDAFPELAYALTGISYSDATFNLPDLRLLEQQMAISSIPGFFRFVMCVNGVFPPSDGPAATDNLMLGQIFMTTLENGSAGLNYCQGQTDAVATQQQLYAVIGKSFPADTSLNFQLPDTRDFDAAHLPAGMSHALCVDGLYPTSGGWPTLGWIQLFAGTTPPPGWAFCDGAIMSIQGNELLFTVLTSAYGGNGYSTFALPDTRAWEEKLLSAAQSSAGSKLRYIICTNGEYPIRLDD